MLKHKLITLIIFSLLFLISSQSYAGCNFPFKKPVQLRYHNGSTEHNAVLQVKNCRGQLNVSFYSSSDKKTVTIQQNVTIKNSPLGILVYGHNPRRLNAQTPITNYAPDNFIFQRNRSDPLHLGG